MSKYMKVPRQVFKSYDIRGLVSQELTVDFAYALGRALVTLLSKETKKPRPTVVVGRDMRPSSVEYETALVRGLVEGGATVQRIGLVSTPAFYFGVSHLRAHGGVMVSASHNPAAYNGFKMVRRGAEAMSGTTGIQELADLMEKEEFVTAEKPGSVEEIFGIADLHVSSEIAFARVGEIPAYSIVADSANGMGAQYLDTLFGEYDNWTIERMYWELDGSFPNHEADPFKAENTADLCARVVSSKADLGVATDGDGDRIFFIDDKGEVVEPAIIRGLVARAILRRYPGATIGYDVRPGKITEDLILEGGGKPLVTQVGHALIKAEMRKTGAIFAGESSGHFYMAMPEGVYEAPVATMLIVLGEMVREHKKLSELIAPLKKYSHSGEINFHVDDKEGAIARVKARYADGKISELDGVSIDYPDFWLNIRMSNTEPLLRLNLEAKDRATMEKVRDEITGIIGG